MASQEPNYRDVCGKCGARRVDSQLGLERTPEEFVGRLVEVFREVRRVLRDDGTLWCNLGDSYAGGGPHHGDRNTGKSATNRGSITGTDRASVPGLKPKDLVGIPWRVAFALQADGWYLRSDIIWHKPNPMPESVTDRPTKAHEYVFLLAKAERYYYNADAIKEPASADTHARYARGRSDDHKWADGGPGGQTIATNKPGSLFARIGKEGRNSRFHQDRDVNHSPQRKPRVPAGWHQGTRPATPSGIRDKRVAGVNPKCVEPGSGIKQNSSFSAAVKDLVEERNKRTVWTIATEPFSEAHFATFPQELVRPCVLAGCPMGGTVLDPFCGSGTAGVVALGLGRHFLGIELSPTYAAMARRRIEGDQPLFNQPQEIVLPLLDRCL
jgi:DNA modification methylase